MILLNSFIEGIGSDLAFLRSLLKFVTPVMKILANLGCFAFGLFSFYQTWGKIGFCLFIGFFAYALLEGE